MSSGHPFFPPLFLLFPSLGRNRSVAGMCTQSKVQRKREGQFLSRPFSLSEVTFSGYFHPTPSNRLFPQVYCLLQWPIIGHLSIPKPHTGKGM